MGAAADFFQGDRDNSEIMEVILDHLGWKDIVNASAVCVRLNDVVTATTRFQYILRTKYHVLSEEYIRFLDTLPQRDAIKRIMEVEAGWASLTPQKVDMMTTEQYNCWRTCRDGILFFNVEHGVYDVYDCLDLRNTDHGPTLLWTIRLPTIYNHPTSVCRADNVFALLNHYGDALEVNGDGEALYGHRVELFLLKPPEELGESWSTGVVDAIPHPEAANGGILAMMPAFKRTHPPESLKLAPGGHVSVRLNGTYEHWNWKTGKCVTTSEDPRSEPKDRYCFEADPAKGHCQMVAAMPIGFVTLSGRNNSWRANLPNKRGNPAGTHVRLRLMLPERAKTRLECNNNSFIPGAVRNRLRRKQSETKNGPRSHLAGTLRLPVRQQHDNEFNVFVDWNAESKLLLITNAEGYSKPYDYDDQSWEMGYKERRGYEGWPGDTFSHVRDLAARQKPETFTIVIRLDKLAERFEAQPKGKELTLNECMDFTRVMFLPPTTSLLAGPRMLSVEQIGGAESGCAALRLVDYRFTSKDADIVHPAPLGSRGTATRRWTIAENGVSRKPQSFSFPHNAADGESPPGLTLHHSADWGHNTRKLRNVLARRGEARRVSNYAGEWAHRTWSGTDLGRPGIARHLEAYNLDVSHWGTVNVESALPEQLIISIQVNQGHAVLILSF